MKGILTKIRTDNRSAEKILFWAASFFLFAFIGWLWEGCFVGFSYGTFLNRGFLHGPWLPIYGFGGTSIIILLQKFKKYPALVFLMATGISGILEYFTSLVLELIFHTRWWDYSDQLLNINGRVSIVNLVLFGIAGLAIVYVAEPLMRKVFRKIEGEIFNVVFALVVILFLVDILLSVVSPNAGIGITYFD